MSDRTSAEIFSSLFKMFAEEATDRDKEYARRVWNMSYGYDFNECQMECDGVLVLLGLAEPSEDENGFPVYEYVEYDAER